MHSPLLYPSKAQASIRYKRRQRRSDGILLVRESDKTHPTRADDRTARRYTTQRAQR